MKTDYTHGSVPNLEMIIRGSSCLARFNKKLGQFIVHSYAITLYKNDQPLLTCIQCLSVNNKLQHCNCVYFCQNYYNDPIYYKLFNLHVQVHSHLTSHSIVGLMDLITVIEGLTQVVRIQLRWFVPTISMISV